MIIPDWAVATTIGGLLMVYVGLPLFVLICDFIKDIVFNRNKESKEKETK